MKSVVIREPNNLVIEQRPLPVPAAGEVRVKVKLAGICGSDSHIYRGHNPFAKYPRVIGHEFFGIIDAVGGRGRAGKRLTLTAEGWSLLEQVIPVWKAAMEELSHQMGSEQLSLTTNMMRSLGKATASL